MTQTGILPWTSKLRIGVIESGKPRLSTSTDSFPSTPLKKTSSKRVFRRETLEV